jgi:hypothetical protein
MQSLNAKSVNRVNLQVMALSQSYIKSILRVAVHTVEEITPSRLMSDTCVALVSITMLGLLLLFRSIRTG